MLIPSTITARRIRRCISTLYIHRTIHWLDFKPMDDGRRYGIQSPNVSNSSAHVAHFNSAFYIPDFGLRLCPTEGCIADPVWRCDRLRSSRSGVAHITVKVDPGAYQRDYRLG